MRGQTKARGVPLALPQPTPHTQIPLQLAEATSPGTT